MSNNLDYNPKMKEKKKRSNLVVTLFGLLLVCLVLIGGGVFWITNFLNSITNGRNEDQKRSPTKAIAQKIDLPAYDAYTPIKQDAPPTPALTTKNSDAAANDKELIERNAPLLAFSKQQTSNQSSTGGSNALAKDTSNTITTPLAARLSVNSLGSRKASKIKNPSLTLTAGTIIPCILETAISSDLAGFVKCRVFNDIFSSDGKVVLLDKGTKVIGEYQGGVEIGNSRLFITWTRAETPSSVVVELASPATDNLGRSGVTGKINTQFWSRFGSAIMLSLIDRGGGVIERKLDKILDNQSQTNSQVNVYGSGSNSGNLTGLARDSVSRGAQMPVIIEKSQGSLVNIFMAKDLDFTGVYSLRLR